MRVALDTNVLVYAEGVNGERMQREAMALVSPLPRDSGALPAQVVGELYHVLVRKAGRSRGAARDAVVKWQDAFPVIDTSPTVMLAAADLATDHVLSIWDAIVMAAAAESGCRLLLSQDLQDGFSWRGVTVTNPFAPTRHPFLDELLSQA
jgi:predicted nucleic acid-binding protein